LDEEDEIEEDDYASAGVNEPMAVDERTVMLEQI
jgi:hypothetical protein